MTIRKAEEATLAILVDRLPEFSPFWPADRIDRWFEWFFALLAAIQRQTSARQAVAADFGLPESFNLHPQSNREGE